MTGYNGLFPLRFRAVEVSSSSRSESDEPPSLSKNEPMLKPPLSLRESELLRSIIFDKLSGQLANNAFRASFAKGRVSAPLSVMSGVTTSVLQSDKMSSKSSNERLRTSSKVAQRGSILASKLRRSSNCAPTPPETPHTNTRLSSPAVAPLDVVTLDDLAAGALAKMLSTSRIISASASSNSSKASSSASKASNCLAASSRSGSLSAAHRTTRCLCHLPDP
mmetsp:Transcript_10404/g.23547  ORF Transcript_10404/g.23547 Transcript_10404/m.23547 type:complete len:221 (+) Transcript_10404:714-1376(+)